MMFRRQQAQQTKPNTGIKSFSSRVERRRKAVVEEKKEEPVKQVKAAIPKRTAKAEDLPVLGVEFSANNVERCDINEDATSNTVTVTITYKPLIGDYTFNVDNRYIKIPVSTESWNAINTVTTGTSTKKAFVKIPSYQPSTIENAKLYNSSSSLSGIRIVDGSNSNNNIAFEFNSDYTSQEWVTIEKLYLVNLIIATKTEGETEYEYYNPPSASGTFTSEDSGSSHTFKIKGISKLDGYTSNAENHTDVKNLYTTNCLYLPGAGESYTEFKNNIVVKGDFEEKIYQYLPISDWKLGYHDDDGEYFQNETDGTYSLHSIGKLPSPDGHEICIMKADGTYVDDTIPTSWDFTQYADFSYPVAVDNVSDISSKFDNFYINNVTLNPSTTSAIKTRFTQVVGNEYMGSNVTILAAPSGSGSGGLVDDKLLPLIRDVEFKGYADDHKYNEVIFTIKPNEKQGLLVENRENAGSTDPAEVPGHIIIDLSSNETLSNTLANWVFEQDGVTDTIVTQFTFVQEAVILSDEWNSSNKPDVRLNGTEGITEMTVKYYKDGAVIVNNLVPSPTEGDGKYTLDKVNSIINKLYLVNGSVGDVNVGTEGNPQTIKRLLTSSPVKFAGEYTEETKTPQITSLPKIEVDQEDVGAEIKEYYPTNMIVASPNDGSKIYNNVVVFGTMPNWTISSELLDPENGYGIKVTSTAGTWDILPLDSEEDEESVILTVNFLPVDGYGKELDIGVNFDGDNTAVIGSSDSPIELPENGTKNELKLLNFNMNEIYVKQTKSTADLDLTATVNHNYEGATVYNAVEMGGVSGTASSITDLISGFGIEGTTLTIKIKPSDKKNILVPYRKGDAEEADKKAIILDITGNLNLCDDLTELIGANTISSIVIEREALILSSNETEIDIRLNGNEGIATLRLKYLEKVNGKYSEKEITVNKVSHKVDQFYLAYGTVTNQLLKRLSASDVFTADKKIVLEKVLILDEPTQDNQVQLLVEEEGIITNVHLTNIINGLEANAVGKSNVVVGGEIPKWVYDDFVKATGIVVPAVEGDNATPAWTLLTVNDLPCSGYGKLDIGINVTPLSIIDLRVKTKGLGIDEDFEDTLPYGKDGFYVDVVTLPKGAEVDQVSAQFTRHNGLLTEGSLIQLLSGDADPVTPTSEGYIKIHTLDQLYNLMMEPRTYVGKSESGSSEVPVGILFAKSNTDKLNDVLLEEGYHLIYYPALGNNIDERLKLDKPEGEFTVPEGAVEVNIKGEILNDKDLDGDDNNGKRSVKVRIYLEYVDKANNAHRIPYGVVGNGPFSGSELDTKYEVDGNKWNLKIEDIMKSINERQVNVDSSTDKLELSVESLTDDENKIKKSEMYEYICEIKRTLNAMPFNSRYLNEILGYLSKCLAFEQVRLPSIREADNQGLESVNEEYDAETNPDGWIEKYTEEFEKNGIIYKVVNDYDNYKFRDGSKHDELINDMRSKLAQIYMFNELGETLKLDQIMNKLLNEYTDIWMKYYKGLVVPNDQIMTDFSDIEIYEDENIYKVFEGNSEEGTHVISQLTDGSAEDEDGAELKAFIEEIMKYFKDEINEVTGTKKDIKGITIEDMVAYEDPLKETTSSNATGEEIDDALTNNENNLIEYSQMLSTIQGERNKLQRQGNKNKIILKFTQTVKGTFFEILGKEKMNSEQKSQIFGFFLSELKEYVSHAKKTVNLMDRKSRRGVKTVQAIPEEKEGKRYLRITKIPEFYVGDPLDWINDNYYSNKIFLQNCDNLYVGIDPELDQRIEPVGTPVSVGSSELKEQEMIGYYILKIQY